jgi:VanZ family protein
MRRSAPRRSPFVRAALLVYIVLLVYGSLSPWGGWRSLGVGPFSFLIAPWPTYVTLFDLTLNVLAYVPLGLLLALVLHPWLRAPARILATAAIAALASILLESAQSYLPTRIASNLDVLANLAGAVIGAVAGTRLAPTLIDNRQLVHAHGRWVRPHATVVVLLAALWPLAQAHPGPMLFGNGEIDRELLSAALGLFGRGEPQFDAGQFAAAEVLVTACAMLGAGAALTAVLKERAPRRRLMLYVLVFALAIKAMTYGHEFGPERSFAWMTTGAVSGLAIGLLAMIAAATAPARAAALLAAASLLVLVVAVNLVPSNPYHAHWLSAWHPGHLRNVAAASEWLGRAWPWAMLGALFWRLLRPPRRPGGAGGHWVA